MGNKSDKVYVKDPYLNEEIKQGSFNTSTQNITKIKMQEIRNQAISPESFEQFFKSIHKLPVTLTEDQFEEITYATEKKNFDQADSILICGNGAVGVFVITSGTANIIASDGTTIIHTLIPGDICGEISSFYNIPCTCSVVAGYDGCKAVYLSLLNLRDLIVNHDIVPIKDWYVQQNYYDFSNVFQAREVFGSIVRHNLDQLPIFKSWSKESLDEVAVDLMHTSVEGIYPAGAFIFSCGDETHSGFIVVRGTFEVFTADHSMSVTISADRRAILLGDEQLFCRNRRYISAKAITFCHVLTISTTYLQSIVEKFPQEKSKLIDSSHKWKQFIQEREQLIDEYDCLDLSLLIHLLSKHTMFRNIHHYHLHLIVLSMSFDVAGKGEKFTLELTIKKIIFLIRGVATVQLENNEVVSLDVGDLYELLYTHKQYHIDPLQETIVAYIDKPVMQSILSS